MGMLWAGHSGSDSKYKYSVVVLRIHTIVGNKIGMFQAPGNVV